MLRAFRAAEPRAKQLSIYAWLSERLDHFAAALPCVAELKSPCMRVRHWGQLMAATGETFGVMPIVEERCRTVPVVPLFL